MLKLKLPRHDKNIFWRKKTKVFLWFVEEEVISFPLQFFKKKKMNFLWEFSITWSQGYVFACTQDVHIICFNTHKDVSIVSCVSGDYKFCRKPNSIFKTQSSVVVFFTFLLEFSTIFEQTKKDKIKLRGLFSIFLSEHGLMKR